MACTYLPLRWESTGDQYWFASPADWAAATGNYDLLRPLLLSDPNLLLSLTSLRRLRRLQSLWDDHPQFSSAAAARSSAARSLFLDAGPALLAAGYGSWLLYTAAAAGDLLFSSDLLCRRPLLVFGEGEYGLADLLYAAGAGRSPDVFRLLLDHALSPRSPLSENLGEEKPKAAEMPPRRSRGGAGSLGVEEFRAEVINRALHAAARGGSWEITAELLRRFAAGGDVLAFRDTGGATVLHSAAARGRVEVIEGLLTSYESMADVRDKQGNAAIHVAAFRGHAAAIEALIRLSPPSADATDAAGDTALHVAIAGFTAPGFRRLDRQMEVVKTLLAVDSGRLVNARNNKGRTALHAAVAANAHADAVALLRGAASVNVNAMDVNGLTAVELLRRRRRGGALRRLISSVGVEGLKDKAARSAMAAEMRESQTLTSPGTSFRVHDSELLLLYGGVDSSLEEEDEIDEEEKI